MLINRNKRIKEKLLSEFRHLKSDSFDFENIESYFRKKTIPRLFKPCLTKPVMIWIFRSYSYLSTAQTQK